MRDVQRQVSLSQRNKVPDEQIQEWAHGTDFVRWICLWIPEAESSCLRREYQLQITRRKCIVGKEKLDILLPQRRKPVVYPRKLARNRTVTDSNQLFLKQTLNTDL
ncbi:hypothetical protein P7H19_21055 [Paenibacillus larvae]|nr:hypothetical protein [Paenibacillus larvae]MDT2238248.1 hypothetical protein [Paenibacillus larvae]